MLQPSRLGNAYCHRWEEEGATQVGTHIRLTDTVDCLLTVYKIRARIPTTHVSLAHIAIRHLVMKSWRHCGAGRQLKYESHGDLSRVAISCKTMLAKKACSPIAIAICFVVGLCAEQSLAEKPLSAPHLVPRSLVSFVFAESAFGTTSQATTHIPNPSSLL